MTQCPADFEITQGDSAPLWISKLGDSRDDPLDLTGATVTLYVWERISDTALVLTGSAVVVTADPVPRQRVQYKPATGDWLTVAPGDYALKWRVVFAGGDKESFPSSHQTVRVFAAPPT